MIKTPFLNALAAASYIGLVVLLMNSLQSSLPKEDTIAIPVFMLSLFVLSVATMAFLFFYQPFRLYFDGHKHQALVFFVRTLLSFACFVILFFIILIATLPR